MNRWIKNAERTLDLIDVYRDMELTCQIYGFEGLREACKQEIAVMEAKLDKTIRWNCAIRPYWDSEVTGEDINRAREHPIENLFPEARNGVVKCPFHEDSRPSASIKKGKLHCFVCNRSWDAIQVLVERDKHNFVSAVMALR